MLIFVYNHIIRYTNHAKIPDKFKVTFTIDLFSNQLSIMTNIVQFLSSP